MIHAKGQTEAVQKYCDAGFMGLIFDTEYGGLQLPVHISALARMPFVAANVGLGGTYMDLTQGVGNLIRACGGKDMAAKWIPRLATGETFGTMCLSETQAGSSLTDVRYYYFLNRFIASRFSQRHFCQLQGIQTTRWNVPN